MACLGSHIGSLILPWFSPFHGFPWRQSQRGEYLFNKTVLHLELIKIQFGFKFTPLARSCVRERTFTFTGHLRDEFTWILLSSLSRSNSLSSSNSSTWPSFSTSGISLRDLLYLSPSWSWIWVNIQLMYFLELNILE